MKPDPRPLFLLSALAWSQAAHCTPPTIIDNANAPPPIEWVEEAAPPPPAFSTAHLAPLELPASVSLKVGIDPATLQIGKDGVVRYVVVMTNRSGAHMASYEGIRCATREVKTYARQSTSGQWSAVAQPQWQRVSDNMPSHHAQAFAAQGACQDGVPNSVADILDTLKNGPKTPFELMRTH